MKRRRLVVVVVVATGEHREEVRQESRPTLDLHPLHLPNVDIVKRHVEDLESAKQKSNDADIPHSLGVVATYLSIVSIPHKGGAFSRWKDILN